MGQQPFRDAEAWLADRGVRRDPIRVRPEPDESAGPPPETPHAAPADGGDGPEGGAPAGQPPEPSGPSGSTAPTSEGGAGPPVTVTEARRLAEAGADEHLRRLDERAAGNRSETPRLEDEVAEAAAFVRRSTANAPQSEARLADKLRERGWADAVVTRALRRCRDAGLVDDEAMAAALVEEGRRKGHALARLRADLRRRALPDEVIERALAPLAREDPEAAAFAVARRKADALTGLSQETAFRRVVGHLARRGHPEALARKVARAAVFEARDPERTAGH